MQGSELEIFKEIPGYKAIMKAVLRNQIQMLVQQLYEHVGEEAVLLTASVSDGSSSYLGSESGKVFVQDHDEIKTQFLGYCLKRHHRKKTEDKSDFQRTSEIVFPSPHLESSSHCSSASLVQRKPHSHKRPAPYSEPSRQGSQRVFDNKRQSVPAKQIPLTAECEHQEQYFQDKKMKTESQNSDNEDTGDFSSATERTGSSALLQGTDDNLQESINAVSTEDVNDSENSSEGEDISVEIKTEPSELLDDTVNSGAAGVESLPEKNDYSKWKTNIAASGEGSLDHVDGETADSKSHMVTVEKKMKRIRRLLTLEQRVHALKLLSSGLSSRKTALSLGVGRTQVQEISKHRDEIMAEWQSEKRNPDRKRKSRKTGNEEINSMCLKWYDEAIADGNQVSGSALQAKALEFAKQLGVPSFKASNGWLERFKKRHMIDVCRAKPKTQP